MTAEKEMTALGASVGADAGQSSHQIDTNSISDFSEKFNGNCEFSEDLPDDFDKILRRINDPSFMHVVSMEEIYGMVFTGKPWIIEGLLHTGVYILAGAPKLGKSFMVAQIAYHVSTGRPLWGHPVHKSPVLYLALEDDHPRLQNRLFRMFNVESTSDLYFCIDAKKIRKGLEEQLRGFLLEHPSTRLIIIDTLKKVRDSDDDSYSYGRDYEDIGLLKKFHYELVGDYYLPCLTAPELPELGIWGQRRLNHLRQHHRPIYTGMLLSRKLNEHLEEVDRTAAQRHTLLMQQMAKAAEITEDLKAADQMAWVQKMNAIDSQVREFINEELIYV